ncbi:MAG: right-handed parallel beta-helix repeat-containing protein [Candidatus Krumholzibacteria bacterium]|nr:right-handed parallel beta-helix repeat-containing protein [Candidatus Krumholzibacteria bacterium]
MRSITFILKRLWVLPAILAVIAGCDESLDFKNTPPGNLEIEKNVCYLGTGKPITLCGSGEDADGDPISYRWTSAHGTFTPSDGAGQCVQWVAPQTAGIYKVTLIVTDEIEESTITEDLVVGQELVLLPGDAEIDDNGSFYIVSSLVPLQVGFRTTLILHDGVTIVFANENGGFSVAGTMQILGTESNPVTIKSNSCQITAGAWTGIYFAGADAAGIIRHANISGAITAISVENNASVEIDTCTIVSCDLGILAADSASVDITGCKIWENGGGIRTNDSHTIIRNSTVRYNGNYGVWIGGGGNSPQADIQYCNVSNNTYFGGFRVSGRSVPQVKNCAIYLNQYGAYLSEYFADENLDFTENYWGYITSTEIADYILDGDDVATGPKVLFNPWLTASPVTY